MKYRSS